LPDHDARAAAEAVARASYGRLVALIASRSRDIAAAEDALSEALRLALETWPLRGIPQRPEAWLLTVARRLIGRERRHRAVQAVAEPTLTLLAEARAGEATVRVDPRLNLLFVCAHPAIGPDIRTPLMLQTVLGIEVERIAAAFLVAPTAMAQRLVRAKAKIRDAGIAFALPEPAEWPERVDAVLAAIYAAYGTGWEDVLGADDRRKGLTEEALFLGRLVVELLPEAAIVQRAEARGLFALMLYCEARRRARRTDEGRFVPLGEQDVRLWSASLIAEAEQHVRAAAQAGQPGRFQLEAAIQSVHCARAATGKTNWRALMLLYDRLAELMPVAGVLVSRAAAYGEGVGAAQGLALLGELDATALSTYQPYWAALAHLLAAAGQAANALEAYQRAIGLSEDEAVRTFLLERADRLRS